MNIHFHSIRQLFLYPLSVGIGFYLSSKFGLALSFEPDHIAVFWPPNSIVIFTLFLVSPGHWWVYILAICPAYFFASHEAGYPVPRAILFFAANCVEIFIPAIIYKYKLHEIPRFNKLKDVACFVILAVVFPPLVSASLSSFATFNESISYWAAWRVWFLGDLVGILILVPLFLTWADSIKNSFQNISNRSKIETIVLAFLLITVTQFSFGGKIGTPGNIPVLVYLPLPLLLWSAIRFGELGNSSSSFVLAVIAIWYSSQGLGPFTTLSSSENVLSLQIFLIVVLTSLLFLTAFIQQYKEEISRRKEGEERLRIVADLSYDVIWQWDIVSGYHKWFGDIDSTLGYEENEFPRTIDAFKGVLHPDDRERVMKNLNKHHREHVKWHEIYRVVKTDGTIKWWDDRGETKWDKDGTPLVMTGAIMDITDRKLSEDKLRLSEQRFRTIFEESPLGVALIDSLTGHIHEVNPRFAEIAGRTREEMATIDWMSITHPDDVQEDLDNMADLNAGRITGFNMNKRYIKPDGSHVWINMTIAPITVKDKTKPRHLCMVEDISERLEAEKRIRETQAQLAHADKLSSLGKLVGAVAHEFNNPLFGVMNLIDQLADDEFSDKKSNLLSLAKKECWRMAGMIKNLQSFYKPSGGNNSIIQIGNLVEDVLMIMAKDIKQKGIKIIRNFPDDEIAIKGVDDQIKQIVINLLQNAADAISGKNGEISLTVQSENSNVILKVQDNGEGIPEEDIDKLFEPFFTTKEFTFFVSPG